MGPRARALWIAVAASVAVLGAALPALAAPRISEIRVEGNEFITDEAFLALLRIQPGDPYDAEVLRQEFRRVWESRLFDNLRLEEEEGADGIILYFVVEEKPRIDTVTYDKTDALTVSKLEEVLDRENLRIVPGSPLDENKISQNKKLVEEMLASEGFTDARVEVVRTQVGNRISIHFTVEPGLKTKIRKIDFAGNTIFSDKQLKKFMKNTSEHWWGSVFSSKDVFYPGKFNEDAELITQEYMRLGYLDARIQDPVLSEVSAKTKDKKRYVDLEIPVVEGLRYTIGLISLEGNTVYPTNELLSLVPIRPGDIANDTLVRLGRVRIEQRYGDDGYIFIAAPHRYEKDPEQRIADLRFSVTEDEQYFVRRIEFEGNTKTKDEVLRREMRVQENDIFNRQDFQVSLRKIGQLGYFKLAEDTPSIQKVPDEPGKVDVTVRGEEVGRNEIQFGGGYSGLDGLFGTFSFQSRNFLGRGESFSASGQLGGSSNRFSISFIEPYFMHTRTTVGGSVYRTELDYDDFTTEGQGGSLFFSMPIRNFSSFTTTYRYQSDKSDLTGTSEDNPIPVETKVSSITPAFIFNTINNPYRPTAGQRLSGTLELASDALGGDYNYYKPIATWTWYFGQGKTAALQGPRGARPRPYFAFHAEAGYIGNFREEDTPIFERFYLGGERSLRAFETRSITPTIVNKITGDEQDFGGENYYSFNFEYAFPISDFFEFATFLDAGNSFGSSSINPYDYVSYDPDGDGLPDFTPRDFEVRDNDWSDIRSSVGIEARFYTPVFIYPLRLIFGYNLDPRPGEDRTDFQFSIGRTFQ